MLCMAHDLTGWLLLSRLFLVELHSQEGPEAKTTCCSTDVHGMHYIDHRRVSAHAL